MPIIEGAISRGVAKFTYDFAALGGAQGDIVLVGEPLPIKAIVWDGVCDVITALGGGATVALTTSQSANDLITAAASIKLTAERAPKIVVTVADLTAGKFNLFIEYYLSD